MQWIAPPSKDTGTATLEKRLWEGADDFRANSGLTSSLDDLGKIPGNNLEALKGNLAGLHSIRVNDQWRIVFKWEGSDAKEVHITDYH